MYPLALASAPIESKSPGSSVKANPRFGASEKETVPAFRGSQQGEVHRVLDETPIVPGAEWDVLNDAITRMLRVDLSVGSTYDAVVAVRLGKDLRDLETRDARFADPNEPRNNATSMMIRFMTDLHFVLEPRV